MTSAAVPRPAATVVLVRSALDHELQVLLVRRNDKVAFMAGAYVFPGGRVDDEDRAHAAQMTVAGGASRFDDLTLAQELAFRVAAVREMEEEAAVRLTLDDLLPIAHWVTPEVETRRYDTRFYLAEMPSGQIARHDGGETTELEWLPPGDAIDRCLRGLIMLPPPTWTTLKQIARFDTVNAARAWALRTRIVRVQPGFIRRDDLTMLTLPGDPLHPAIPGWEVPEDTRFVLEDGRRWKPARA